MSFEFFISAVLSGITAASALLAIFEYRRRRKVWRTSGIDAGPRVPSLVLAALLAAGERLPPGVRQRLAGHASKRIAENINASGLCDIMSAEDFCVARVLAALAGGALLLLVFPDSPAKAVVAGLAAGWLGLAMWLRMLCAKRKEAILISLPGALDGLALSVEAGLDFGQALGRVALRIGSGPLKEEFERLDSAMRIGVPRREALKAMSVRAGVRELSSFSTLLIQADILGTGVGPVLRTVSARLRSARLARAERKGILAAQKALLPLAFCIMPATFVVVFGPLIVRFAAGGIEGLF